MKHLFLVLFSVLLSYTLVAQQTHCEDAWYEGEGTQYGGVAGGAGGHCAIPVASGDIYHAAMNHEQYAASEACGACVRILGPKGTVVLKIVDECPECKFGDIDMTTAVFPQLADMKDGRISIKWQYVPCPLTQDITLLFAAGSGPYYFKVQLRDFYYPISTLEYKKKDGSYEQINREVYNYFVAPLGIDEDKQKTGPYHFRVTAVTGQMLEIPDVIFSTTESIHTGVQFQDLQCPDCNGVAGGIAAVDNCGVCSAGNTGIATNSTCEKDCAGYWEGTAYADGCGKCVAGTTGATPCDLDCAGSPGGLAYLDNCQICVGGTTGLQPCKKDCNNEWGGDAINCDVTTSINPVFEEDAVILYPNPFTNELNIQTNLNSDAEIKVKIINIAGQLVCEKIITDRIIDTSILSEGLYILLLIQDKEVYVQKLQKRE